jgi:hypothetical protein
MPKALAPGGRLIIEGAARRPLRLSLPVVIERRYGDTIVTLYREASA